MVIFGVYKFVTENVDFENGIEVRQSFKDDMSAVGNKIEGLYNSAKDYFKN